MSERVYRRTVLNVSPRVRDWLLIYFDNSVSFYWIPIRFIFRSFKFRLTSFAVVFVMALKTQGDLPAYTTGIK